MRYRCHDLHHQRAGTTVTVNLHGTVCNAILVDEVNFERYRRGQAFLYVGGRQRESPVTLEVPEDGHWYAVVDLGGYKGRVKATVEVQPADEAEAPSTSRTLVLT
jgi:hypothetical protein